jgi:mannitol/fructose-specific phosphotransferase system IIA component (Ntr-type)
MNDTNEVFPMDNAEWREIVKSIPVVCDITETTAEGIVRQVLKAVFEKNGLPMDKLDNMVSTVIAHSLGDICFTAMHGLAIPHGYVSGLEKLLVGIGVLRHGHSIDFNAMDGSRTHIFFVLVCSSPNHAGYRQFLARLCKCLISDDMVSRLASVSTRTDLEALLGCH